MIWKKVCKFLAIHRLLSQNKDEFETFFEKLDLCFDHMAEKNHFMIAVFCNFKQSQNFGILMIILVSKSWKLTFWRLGLVFIKS